MHFDEKYVPSTLSSNWVYVQYKKASFSSAVSFLLLPWDSYILILSIHENVNVIIYSCSMTHANPSSNPNNNAVPSRHILTHYYVIIMITTNGHPHKLLMTKMSDLFMKYAVKKKAHLLLILIFQQQPILHGLYNLMYCIKRV